MMPMRTLHFQSVFVGIAVILLLVLAAPAFAAEGVRPGKMVAGEKYYFDVFQPEQKPWDPGQPLNIEEVFKNYQYVEIVLDRDGQGITVHHFVQGIKQNTERYSVLPDGTLQKKAGVAQ